MTDITFRYPPEGWGAFPVDDDVHVVPVEGEEAQGPAAGHLLSVGCSCRPKRLTLSEGPLPLDGVIWSHREPTWAGANPEPLQ